MKNKKKIFAILLVLSLLLAPMSLYHNKTNNDLIQSRSSSGNAQKDSFTVKYNGTKYKVEVTENPKTEKTGSTRYEKGCPVITIYKNNEKYLEMYLTESESGANLNTTNGFKKYMKMDEEKRHATVEDLVKRTLKAIGNNSEEESNTDTSKKKSKKLSITIISDKGEETFYFEDPDDIKAISDDGTSGPKKCNLSFNELKKAKYRLNNLKEDKCYSVYMSDAMETGLAWSSIDDFLGCFINKSNKKSCQAAKCNLDILNPYTEPAAFSAILKINSTKHLRLTKKMTGNNPVIDLYEKNYKGHTKHYAVALKLK